MNKSSPGLLQGKWLWERCWVLLFIHFFLRAPELTGWHYGCCCTWCTPPGTSAVVLVESPYMEIFNITSKKNAGSPSWLTASMSCLIGEDFRFLDNTLWEMQWEEAKALRLFSEWRRARVGEFPSRWLGRKEWSLTGKRWGNGFGRNEVCC